MLNQFTGSISQSVGGPIADSIREADLLFSATPEEFAAFWQEKQRPGEPPQSYAEYRKFQHAEPVHAAFSKIREGMRELAAAAAALSPIGQAYGSMSFSSSLAPSPGDPDEASADSDDE